MSKTINFSTNITLLRSGFHRTLNVQRRTFNIELLQSLVSSPKQKTKFFVRIRPGARKPAKVKAVGMQGVKERACELLLRPCSPTAYYCGLEGGDRPFG